MRLCTDRFAFVCGSGVRLSTGKNVFMQQISMLTAQIFEEGLWGRDEIRSALSFLRRFFRLLHLMLLPYTKILSTYLWLFFPPQTCQIKCYGFLRLTSKADTSWSVRTPQQRKSSFRPSGSLLWLPPRISIRCVRSPSHLRVSSNKDDFRISFPNLLIEYNWVEGIWYLFCWISLTPLQTHTEV